MAEASRLYTLAAYGRVHARPCPLARALAVPRARSCVRPPLPGPRARDPCYSAAYVLLLLKLLPLLCCCLEPLPLCCCAALLMLLNCRRLLLLSTGHGHAMAECVVCVCVVAGLAIVQCGRPLLD